MSRSHMKTSRDRSVLFSLVTGATGLLAIFLGVCLWSLAPAAWRQYWETADGTVALLGLFLGLPAALGLLWLLGFVCGALALTRFVSREEAEKAILSSPYGGHIGRWELRLLSRFKSHAGRNT
jgi:small-conductance mechanosensitive channel